MKSNLRKLVLTAHLTFSIGWLGAVVAYLALAIVGLTSHDPERVRAVYLSLEVVGWYVIVPFSLTTVVVGLVASLGTPWGLIRHWWVLVKLVLTTGATIVLLRHMPAVSRAASAAREMTLSAVDDRPLRTQLVLHAAGGLLVLFATTVLSVYKPWGMTAYGLRKRQEGRQLALEPSFRLPSSLEPASRREGMARSWASIIGIHAIHVIGLALVLLVVHLAGGGTRHH